jgi:hypothetical protein
MHGRSGCSLLTITKLRTQILLTEMQSEDYLLTVFGIGVRMYYAQLTEGTVELGRRCLFKYMVPESGS